MSFPRLAPAAFFFISIVFNPFFALSQSSPEQGTSNDLFDSYVETCAAHANVMLREKELKQWRLETMQKLQDRGHASWLEVRRIQLNAESIQARINAFAKYNSFLRELQTELESRAGDGFDSEGSLQAIRVFLPGSNRLVGWLEGPRLDEEPLSNVLKNAKAELASIKNRLATLNQRLNTALNDKQWQKKSRLKYDLELARFRFQQSKVTYLEQLQSHQDSFDSSVAFASNRNLETISPNSDANFKSLVAGVAHVEANSEQKLELIKRHLIREQTRLNSLEELALHGHATKKEINHLKQHIWQLRNARETVASNLINLQHSLIGILGDDANFDSHSGMRKSYLEVSQWPSDIVENANHLQYVIEQRNVCYKEMAKLNIALQRHKMLDDIIERLEIATKRFASNNKDSDKLGELLVIGQQKELDSYKWKRESLKQAIKDSQDKIQILVLEEHRFMRQSVLMSHAKPIDNKATIVGNNVNPNFLVSIVSSYGNLVAAANNTTTQNQSVRIGYIESDLLDTIGPDIDLVFSQNAGYPLGFAEDHEDLLRPVRLTDYSRSLNFAGNRTVRLRHGPNYSGTFGQNFAGRSYYNSNRSIAAPSLYNSPYATNQYRSNQIEQSRFYKNAYPFGVLRSDLRRYAPFQPPWYFPGSPNNLRFNQLQTDFNRSDGSTGYEKLKSRNYIDLSRPGFQR